MANSSTSSARRSSSSSTRGRGRDNSTTNQGRRATTRSTRSTCNHDTESDNPPITETASEIAEGSEGNTLSTGSNSVPIGNSSSGIGNINPPPPGAQPGAPWFTTSSLLMNFPDIALLLQLVTRQ